MIQYLKNQLKKLKVPGLLGLSLFDLLNLYFTGLLKGALGSRAGGISFSFFMAVFPFMLFMLTLIPYIPVDGFQENFMLLIRDMLPPSTYDSVESILVDIAENKYGGLLSFGFVASIFLMTNGVNAIFGGFEYSYHVKEARNVIKAYIISLGTSLLLSVLLITTVVVTILFEYGLNFLIEKDWLSDAFIALEKLRYIVFVVLIYTTVSFLYKYGTKLGKHTSFFSAGAGLTTFLYILTFNLFGLYVTKFSNYNELYGSIGTLLVLMLFIWLNSIILLLGFELNATIGNLKNKQSKALIP